MLRSSPLPDALEHHPNPDKFTLFPCPYLQRKWHPGWDKTLCQWVPRSHRALLCPVPMQGAEKGPVCLAPWNHYPTAGTSLSAFYTQTYENSSASLKEPNSPSPPGFHTLISLPGTLFVSWLIPHIPGSQLKWYLFWKTWIKLASATRSCLGTWSLSFHDCRMFWVCLPVKLWAV